MGGSTRNTHARVTNLFTFIFISPMAVKPKLVVFDLGKFPYIVLATLIAVSNGCLFSQQFWYFIIINVRQSIWKHRFDWEQEILELKIWYQFVLNTITLNTCQRRPNKLYYAFEKKIFMKMKTKNCRYTKNKKLNEIVKLKKNWKIRTDYHCN